MTRLPIAIEEEVMRRREPLRTKISNGNERKEDGVSKMKDGG
jgi:hypothetical protein